MYAQSVKGGLLGGGVCLFFKEDAVIYKIEVWFRHHPDRSPGKVKYASGQSRSYECSQKQIHGNLGWGCLLHNPCFAGGGESFFLRSKLTTLEQAGQESGFYDIRLIWKEKSAAE